VSLPEKSLELTSTELAQSSRGSKESLHESPNSYPKEVGVSDDEFAKIKVELDPFPGAWNYSLRPS
jgi:hypothetical protein